MRTNGWRYALLGILTFGLSAVAVSGNDAKVLAEIHQINLTEIQVGKIAEKQGKKAETRKFGRMLVSDHSVADQKLAQIVKEEGMTLPDLTTTPEGKQKADMHRQMVDRLASIKTGQFDGQFATAMEGGHGDALTLVRTAQGQVENTKVQGFLADLVPELEKHRAEAMKLEKRTHTAE